MLDWLLDLRRESPWMIEERPLHPLVSNLLYALWSGDTIGPNLT